MPVFLVFFSGLSALVYEIVWMRVFLPVFGLSVYSTTTVLCAFMGGLGSGSYLAAPAARKWKRPLWELYVLLNLGVGVTALAVPYLARLIVPAYVSLSSYDALKVYVPAVRFLLSFAAMAVPTVLMGMTLPVLVQASGGRIGLLYGVNTAGGAFGCLLAGFVLIYRLGLAASTFIASSVNIVLALAALFFYRSSRQRPAARPRAGEKSAFFAPPARTLLFFYALAGAAALSYELIWTRILVFYLQSATYSFSIMLTVFLTGIGCGSLFFSEFLDAREGSADGLKTVETAGRVQLGLGVLALGTLHLYGRLGEIGAASIAFFGASTWQAINLQKMFIAGLVTFPPAFLMGVAFPLFAKMYKRRGADDAKAVGDLYAANTAGAIAGTLLTGFVLFDKIGAQGALTAVSSMTCLIGIALLGVHRKASGKSGWAGPGLAAVYLVMVLSLPGKMLFADYRKHLGDILFYKESAADITMVSRDAAGVRHLVFHDGRGTSATSAVANYFNRMYAYSAMMAAPGAKDVLVICMGVGNTASAFSKFPIESLDIVDISPGAFEAAEYFPTNENVLKDPRVRVYVEDGRNFLLKSKKRYDIIQIEPPAMHTDGVVGLYTKEFYRIAYSKLKPEGVLVQWLDVAQAGKEISYMAINTLRDVFPNSTLWARRRIFWWVLGRKSDEKTWIRYEKAKELFSREEVRKDMEKTHTSFEDILASLTVSAEDLRTEVGGSKTITDDKTLVDFYLPRLKRPDAFGGGLAYYSSPLKEAYLKDWRAHGLKMTDEVSAPSLSPEQRETYSERALQRVVDGLPEGELERIRSVRKGLSASG